MERSRGRQQPTFEAAVRSCVTIPVRRRRAPRNSAICRRCVCGSARYRRVTIKGFYSQTRPLRNPMQTRDTSGARSTPRAGPESGRGTRGIAPMPVRERARSDGQCGDSGSLDPPLMPWSRLDLAAGPAPRGPWHGQCTRRCHDVRQRTVTRRSHGRVEAHGGEA